MAPAETAVGTSEAYTGESFDLAFYLAKSKQLDVSDLDWDSVRDHPVSAAEIRCLGYMMDIEAHTLCYLRDVLNADAGADPEIADFLGCWLYEESYHGRAIERFVRAAGVERSIAVCGQHVKSLSERLEDLGTWIVSRLFAKQFVTVYMTWGSIQEHSTLFGYTNMARQTKNPVLAELLRRIAREESRHFGFYYYKACQGLKASALTRFMVGWLLRHFWTPVGEGVKPKLETDFLLANIFAGDEGAAAIERIDKTMARLPGLSWFDLMGRRHCEALERRRLGIVAPVPA
ncbi:MAG: acyl-ACP desaturase [Elusimicrobia bacterium]|nr:acyl-ACP desaturase [Elusimicrobiota bacterium]